MTIQSVIDLAVSGELKSIGVKTETETIIGFINLGLIELYKRFPVKTVRYELTLIPGQKDYKLPKDCMWIVSAYEVTEDDVLLLDGNTITIPVNEEDNVYSLFSYSWDTIKIPSKFYSTEILGKPVTKLFIEYVATPKMYTEADTSETIPIPAQMLEALLHYIGYRGHGSVNGNIQAENNTHYDRFELSCKRIEQKGMYTNSDLNMDSRLYTRGYV